MHRALLPAALLAISSGPIHAQDCPIEGLVQTIGTGTSGSAGELRLVNVGAPLLDQSLRVELRGGAAHSSGLVLLGTTAAPVPLPEFGGVAQVLPPYLVAAVGFDAQGNSTPAFELTPVPDFCGSQAFLQGLCIDGTAAGGLSLSNALRLRFGGVQQGPLFPQPTAELDLFPLSITSGDLNDDGVQDLVVGDIGGAAYYPGNGDGSFGTRQTLGPFAQGRAVTTADLSGDGIADVAVAGGFTGAYHVALGLGAGAYGPWQDYVVGGFPFDLHAADLNNDGLLDLLGVDSESSSLTVLIGSGAGQFAPPVQYPVGGDTNYAAVADFNGDGDLDVAVNRRSLDDLWVLLGAGDGTLGAGASFPAGNGPYAVATGDFDMDGVPDLAATNSNTAQVVAVLRGLGDGTFEAPSTYPAFFDLSLVSADLNADGAPDLLIGEEVLLNQGDGSFGAPVLVGAAPGPFKQFAAVEDMNDDGILDLLISYDSTDLGNGIATVLLGKGGASFVDQQYDFAGVGTWSATLADFDGDPHPDVATVIQLGGAVQILLGAAGGEIEPAASIATGATVSNQVASGDFNGDGRDDLVVLKGPDSEALILMNTGYATFFEPVGYPVSNPPNHVAVGDLNNDGHQDLAVGSSFPAVVDILLGAGDGTFAPAGSIDLNGGGSADIEAHDLNGDGVLDLVVPRGTFNNAAVLIGLGDGSFAPAQTYTVGTLPQRLTIGDFNGDGHPDLAFTLNTSNEVAVLRGFGDGTFSGPRTYSTGDRPQALTAADFDGDGNVDLAVATIRVGDPWPSDFGHTVILRGAGDATFGAPELYPGPVDPNDLTHGDLNGDGMPDLVGVGRVDVRTLLNQVLEHSGSKDCNGNGVPDQLDIASGTSLDVDSDGIPDECISDCNGNGIDDANDIETGFSQDCNQNGIPDECDLLFGGATDSDLNGQLDECETVAYFSEDFEAGAAGWSFNTPEASIWHVAPDGECGAVTQAAAFNRGPIACDYASELVPQGSLESPAFTLDGPGPFTLSFTNRVDIAPSSIATLFVYLQRTTDPGTIFTIDGASFDSSGVLEELSFDVPNTAEWAGYEARLRFQFIGGIGANAGSGWQIDNVSVTSAP
ncbi:MAG: FG-GAP repeat domain-containing protein [Planctomycetota bacterium]|jgi:hypothetical protein